MAPKSRVTPQPSGFRQHKGDAPLDSVELIRADLGPGADTGARDDRLDRPVVTLDVRHVADRLQPMLLGGRLENEVAIVEDHPDERLVHRDVENSGDRDCRHVPIEDAVDAEHAHIRHDEAIGVFADRSR